MSLILCLILIINPILKDANIFPHTGNQSANQYSSWRVAVTPPVAEVSSHTFHLSRETGALTQAGLLSCFSLFVRVKVFSLE